MDVRSNLTPRRPLAALLVIATFTVTACGGSVAVNSNKAPDYTKRLDRVLIACPLDHLPNRIAEGFRTQLVAELKKRGTEARFAVLESALAIEKPPSLEQQAKDFNATTALIMRNAGGVVDSYGNLLQAKFDGEIWDLPLNKRIWRAQITFRLSGALTADDRLSKELLRTLVKDGLVEGPMPGETTAAEAPSGEQGPYRPPGT